MSGAPFSFGRRTVFMGPDGVRELSAVSTEELRAWLERSDRMFQTPDMPVMQDDVRAELARREVPTAYVDGSCACGASNIHPPSSLCGPVEPLAPPPAVR
jgi:hypothetical protein